MPETHNGTPSRFDGVRAVFFDLDGTLLRDDYIAGVVEEVSQEAAERLDGFAGSDLARAHRTAWAEYWPHAGAAWMAGEVTFDAFPREVWRRALATFDVTDENVVDAAFHHQFAREERAHALYTESRSVLEELRARGLALGLITNGPTDLQRAKLRRVEIEQLFDVVLVSGELGVQKPQPEIFGIGLERLGVDASAALHIGDNLIADVHGAREVGMAGVWINRTGSDQRTDLHVMPDATVTTLDGLLHLLG